MRQPWQAPPPPKKPILKAGAKQKKVPLKSPGRDGGVSPGPGGEGGEGQELERRREWREGLRAHINQQRQQAQVRWGLQGGAGGMVHRRVFTYDTKFRYRRKDETTVGDMVGAQSIKQAQSQLPWALLWTSGLSVWGRHQPPACTPCGHGHAHACTDSIHIIRTVALARARAAVRLPKAPTGQRRRRRAHRADLAGAQAGCCRGLRRAHTEGAGGAGRRPWDLRAPQQPLALQGPESARR